MPIWFELLILLLVTYVIGIGVGWALWGRVAEAAAGAPDSAEGEISDG